MDHLPLLLGAIFCAGLAFLIVRKVAAVVFKLSILVILGAILALLAYVYRDQLPFLP